MVSEGKKRNGVRVSSFGAFPVGGRIGRESSIDC